MLKYLKTLNKVANSTAIADYTVVTGNQAADMDTCCSSLVTAYLEANAYGTKAIPLIPTSRESLRLRRDIVFVFSSLGIEPSWLLFNDDLQPNENTDLFLVDHNAATTPGKVKAILDHHEFEDPNQSLADINPARIVKSGSCMSVVINYYLERNETMLSELLLLDKMLAPLALSPILQDTNNMTRKVEDEDRKAVSYLSRYLGKDISDFSPFASFGVMKTQKDNLKGLSMRDLLRKDYKQWGTIGISSLPKLVEKLVKKGAQDLPGAITRYKEEKNLDVMVALASGHSSRSDEYERQLMFCGQSDFDIAIQCPDLDLIFVSEMGNVKFYNQKNTAASRKQVAPLLRAAYRQFTARNQTES